MQRHAADAAAEPRLGDETSEESEAEVAHFESRREEILEVNHPLNIELDSIACQPVLSDSACIHASPRPKLGSRGSL